MSRKTNIISNILSLGLTVICFLITVLMCNKYFYEYIMGEVLLWFVLGAIICGLLNAFAHELGHVVAGKKNGFAFSSVSIWFFKWTKIKKNIRFSFVLPLDEAGYSEMIPTKTDNISLRYRNMTLGGLYGGIVLLVLGIIPFFIVKFLSFQVFVLWAMLLPLSIYYVLGNYLPMSSNGIRNDGAVLFGIKKNDFTSIVSSSLLAVQAQLYEGKTPAMVDEDLLFSLPQLAEDDPVYIMLLSARLNFYLDKEDYENAKAIIDRLSGLYDEMPKAYLNAIKTEVLYSACTYYYNEDLADDLMYELDKYLNNVNSVSNVRAKLSYILYVSKGNVDLDVFYKKGVKEANRCQIRGLGAFEKKLFDKLKADFPNK